MSDKNSRIPPESSQFISAASLRVRLDWFNKLRWGAAVGVITALVVVGHWLKYPLPTKPLAITAGILLLTNVVYVVRNKLQKPVNIKSELVLVKIQMFCDLILLTVILHLSGGIENPLLFTYLIHVILASLLLKGNEIFQIAWMAIILFTFDVFGEYFGWLPHHHLLSASTLTHELPYVLMTLSSFWLVLLFSAYMGASIMKHNRSIKDELVVRQEELIDTDRAKMSFFRYVTHEVKSPINTAQSAVETVLELSGPEMSDTIRGLLVRSLGRLSQATDMVKDLADLTRGGMKKREPLQDVDLNFLINRLVKDQEDAVERSGQTITFEMPTPAVVIKSRGAMVEKIIINLISNAIRYNKDGGHVSITLTLTAKGACCSVEDQGIGIEPEDQEKIFDEFYRTPAAQQVSTLGTGLGLPIVKNFIDSLGGKILLESEPGNGSTFTVELPNMKENKKRRD